MLLLLTLFFSGRQTAVAAEEAIKPPSGEDTTEKTLNRDEILKQIFGGQDLFFYHRENRPDPFLPFIREKVLQQKMGSEEVVEEELTGLRKFEPGQLTLVAIVFKGKIPMAMVQDPVGLGYILEEGTKIGRYGIVEEITPSAVIVQQTTRTWDQEKLFKRVEMVLPKEGEK